MNYGEIKTAITNRSHRTDLTSHLPEFIELAEAEYNRRTESTHNLTGGADTVHNWLSDNAPDVYIFGGLMQMAVWTNDDNGLQKYTALFERALETAHWISVRESGIAGEPLRTELLDTASSYDITVG